MRLLPVVVAAAILAPLPLSAQGRITDPAEIAAFLSEFEGAWSGRGTSRTSLDSDPEVGQCGLRAYYTESPLVLTTDGECATATASQRVPLNGRLEYTPNGLSGGFFSGFQTAQLLESTVDVFPTYLEIDVAYSAELDGEVRRIDMTVSVGRPVDGRFAMVLEVLDPDTGQMVEFTRMNFGVIRSQ